MKPKQLARLGPLKKLIGGLKEAGLEIRNLKMDWIENCVESLFKLGAFQVEDRVILIRTPDFEKSYGWAYSSHFLKEGAAGYVKDIEFFEGKFSYLVEFDNESSVHYLTKEVKPTPLDKRHCFCFRASWLKKELENVCIYE